MTRVSVITIAWRNEAFAAEFASSLLAAVENAGGEPPELVLVTNGPEGAAASAEVRVVCQGVKLDPVEVVLDANRGFSGGMDAGVERSAGEVVVMANLDLTFGPYFLAALLREADEPWDLLAPRVRQGAAGLEAGVSRRRPSHRLAWMAPPPDAAVVPAGNGACVVLRRSVIERRVAAAGALFDPEYHSFNEDIDLFWWAEREGLAVRYAPAVQVDHALAGSFGGDYAFKRRPLDVQQRVMANYRVTVWKNALGFADWVGWPLGEAQYFAQAVLSRGMVGLRAYFTSWPTAVSTARAIRRRRGRLRVAARRSM